jgi:CheY-like chemotaxis protein
MIDAKQDTAAAKPLKILVIEDDTLTRMTLCRQLQKMGYLTVEACNGFMGLTQFKRERPDIVFTDIVMPDKEGIATIHELRAIDPKARIIAMSGGQGNLIDCLQMAEDVGAVKTLKKPFTPSDIATLVNALIVS